MFLLKTVLGTSPATSEKEFAAYDDLFEQWETVKDECGAATETEVLDLDELQTLVGVEVECDDHVVETVGAHGEVSTVDGEVHQLADGADGAEEFLLVAVVVGEGGDDLEHLAAHVAEGVVQVQFQVDAVGLHVVAPHGEDPVGVVVAPTVAEEDAGDGVACIGVAGWAERPWRSRAGSSRGSPPPGRRRGVGLASRPPRRERGLAGGCRT